MDNLFDFISLTGYIIYGVYFLFYVSLSNWSTIDYIEILTLFACLYRGFSAILYCFDGLRYFVKLLNIVLYDMINFLALLSVVLFYFSVLLYMADMSTPGNTTGSTLKAMFYEVFNVMLVNYSYSFSTHFLEIMLIYSTVLLVIVMLNLLISIISNTHEIV